MILLVIQRHQNNRLLMICHRQVVMRIIPDRNHGKTVIREMITRIVMGNHMVTEIHRIIAKKQIFRLQVTAYRALGLATVKLARESGRITESAAAEMTELFTEANK